MVLEHTPVLLAEVVAALAPRAGELFVDCTLGRGGHAEALLEAADCRVIGLDRDPAAIAATRARLARFGDRLRAVHAPFSSLSAVLDDLGEPRVDGLLADLGVSSPQLDDPARGFSFRDSGPVDMRMDPTSSPSAADLVNEWDESELARVVFRYGEEKRSRAVARALVAGRPWTDTAALAAAVAKAVGGRPTRIHPATRTFQALRIAVNDELGELERLLPVAIERLAPGGRLAIISFHSLEDRIVKRFLAAESGRTGERDPWGDPVVSPRVLAQAKAVRPPSDDPNPRARSARLRTASRLAAPVPESDRQDSGAGAS
jgi:16S rRNA (cytosine1402-N4)-methyltransferase